MGAKIVFVSVLPVKETGMYSTKEGHVNSFNDCLKASLDPSLVTYLYLSEKLGDKIGYTYDGLPYQYWQYRDIYRYLTGRYISQRRYEQASEVTGRGTDINVGSVPKTEAITGKSGKDEPRSLAGAMTQKVSKVNPSAKSRTAVSQTHSKSDSKTQGKD
jgi:hypothetical protein